MNVYCSHCGALFDARGKPKRLRYCAAAICQREGRRLRELTYSQIDVDCPTSIGDAFKAASYIRMSTEHQNYSPEHQLAAITEYAAAHRLEIVQSYQDLGRSGLQIHNRPALQRLIADVQQRRAEFDVVLAYDVSRWGRFQDVDESAYYEFICRRANIQVLYCAEQFENDGSAISSLLKSLKRAMAAEYSRELSAKVFTAQCRFIEKGYKPGGRAGYGLRRMLCGRDGEHKGTLRFGDRKGLADDRVILVLGPPVEVAIVRKIYEWYLNDKLSDTAIANRLNVLKVSTATGGKWVAADVLNILTNEKYIGNLTYNRCSSKLRTSTLPNPPELWKRKVGAFPGIVSPEVFHEVILQRKHRHKRWTVDDLIAELRRVYEVHGKVTQDLILKQENAPHPKCFMLRFGSMAKAYEIAGIPATKFKKVVASNREMRLLNSSIIDKIFPLAARVGGIVSRSKSPTVVHINGHLTLCVRVVRARHDSANRLRWRLSFASASLPDFILFALLCQANDAVTGFYLFPRAGFPLDALTIRNEERTQWDTYRFETLESVFGGDPN